MVILQEKETLVLRNLLAETKVLNPQLDIKFGSRYPDLEEMLKESPEEVKRILKKLSEEGFLKKEFHKNIVKCSKCSEYGMIGVYRCPTCKSGTISRSEVLQHRKCGFTGSEQEFMKEEGYVCPYCQVSLKKMGDDYERVGSWYKCKECGASFGEPDKILTCANCKEESAWKDAPTEETYIYVIDEEKIREEVPESGLEKIESILGESWEAVIPSEIKGKSGVPHIFSFSLVGKKEPVVDKSVVVDVEYSETEVSEGTVKDLFSKCLDVNPDLAILIAVPKMTKSAVELSKTYDLKVVEAEKIEESLNSLKAVIDQHFGIGEAEKNQEKGRSKKGR